MGDRCYSILICARPDKDVFEKMGYQADDSEALTVQGHKIPGAIVMVDEEANGGHYDELTTLTGVPFLVCNGSCPGAYGDHLLASDGAGWDYAEALHESNYPAVRVEPEGMVQWSEVEEAKKYWKVCASAVTAMKTAALGRERMPSDPSGWSERGPHSTKA
jgi:hypothetical protein